MNIATLSSKFRFAFASGALALTAGLFAAGCGAEAGGSPTGENVDQAAQAQTTTPVGGPVVQVRTYPPHGYPCLGCHPCGGSYCDNFNNMVVCTGDGTPVAPAPVTQTK